MIAHQRSERVVAHEPSTRHLRVAATARAGRRAQLRESLVVAAGEMQAAFAARRHDGTRALRNPTVQPGEDPEHIAYRVQ